MPKAAKNRVFCEKKNLLHQKNHRRTKNLEKSTQFRAESQSYSTLGSSLSELSSTEKDRMNGDLRGN